MAGIDPALVLALQHRMARDQLAVLEDPNLGGMVLDLDDPPPCGVRNTVLVASRLTFEVAEEPKPGQVLLDFGGNTELLHLAESVTVAEPWIARKGYRNARLAIVGEDVGAGAREADIVA